MFSQVNPFDKLLDNATSPNLLEIDWSLNLEVCDSITLGKVTPKYALNAIKKKILSPDPHVSLYAVQLLNSCVSNCGLNFHLEVCSREFEYLIVQVLAKGHPMVIEKMKEYIKRWSEQEFKDNPKLSLIPALYQKLKKEGVKFDSTEPVKRKIEFSTDPNVVSSKQEEDDIAKAIELSLKETTSPKNSNNNFNSSVLYPSIDGNNFQNSGNQSPVKESYKVRALYDFEAAEDNEITFKAGEILMVIDDSDSNWWKGSNHRGEGLFPANFVTKDLDQEIESTKSAEKQKTVQFNEEVRVKLLTNEPVTEIDEAKIDRLLYLLHEADPTGEQLDSDELIQLEEQCLKMGPLIDQELEVVDKTHASLSNVNSQLVEALNIYCSLMKENPVFTPANMANMQRAQHMKSSQQLPAQTINYQSEMENSYAQMLQSYPNSFIPVPNLSSIPPTGPPYNHIYSTPGINHTSTTYILPHIQPNIQYGEINSQQIPPQPPIDVNTSASLPTNGHIPQQQQQQQQQQQPQQQMVNNQVTYSQQL